MVCKPKDDLGGIGFKSNWKSPELKNGSDINGQMTTNHGKE
jgi:hypothetical protein